MVDGWQRTGTQQLITERFELPANQVHAMSYFVFANYVHPYVNILLKGVPVRSVLFKTFDTV